MDRTAGKAGRVRGGAENPANLELIRQSLECLDQGVGVFDRNLRLAAFNNKFLDLAGFGADEMRVGTPYEDFIRGGAEKGAYGEDDAEARVRECVDSARQSAPSAFEWVRPRRHKGQGSRGTHRVSRPERGMKRIAPSDGIRGAERRPHVSLRSVSRPVEACSRVLFRLVSPSPRT